MCIAAGTTQLLGSSPALRAVQKQIGRASASGSTVLITGETGTGKEVAARVLHDASARHAGPFVTVNCAAIPESLLESELFGHARGAFTGAVVDRVGRLVRAHGGSLFLDEIGDMPLPMQVKLLRALQEREVTPVGSNKTISIDIRVIAATHRNLHDEMGQGRFREDLFYRLNVIPIHLPPLRERQGDILPLAEHFLRHGDDEGQAAGRRLSPPAQRLILDHPWPGNVRELQNAMQRVSALSAGPVITAGDLGFLGDSLARLPDPSPPAAVGLTLPEAVARLERELIADALTKAAGNRADAARRLGISRQTLYAKLALYGLDL